VSESQLYLSNYFVLSISNPFGEVFLDIFGGVFMLGENFTGGLRRMIRMLFGLLLIAVGLSPVTGCSGVQLASPIAIRGLVIRNDSAADLRNIEMLVEKTRTVVNCSYIPARGKFSTEFPLREYQGNYVIVSFAQGGRTYKTRPLYAQISDDLDRSEPVEVVVIIDPRGQVSVQLSP
jgi:hypothetical protein